MRTLVMILVLLAGCEPAGFDLGACGGEATGTYAVLNGSPRLSTTDYDYVARGLACQGWSGQAIGEATGDDVSAALGSPVDLVYYTGHGDRGAVAVKNEMLWLEDVRIRARVVIFSACEVLASNWWIDADPGVILMGYAEVIDTASSAEVAMEMLRQMREGHSVVEAFSIANYAAGLDVIFYKAR